MKLSRPAVSFLLRSAVAILGGTTTAQEFEAFGQTNTPGAPTAGVGAQPGRSLGVPADIDGDGDLDVVLLPGSALRNHGDLAYEFEPAGTSIPAMGLLAQLDAIGDIDGDGILDLVRAQPNLLAGTTSITMMRGQQGGTWSLPQSAGTANGNLVRAQSLLDVDGDGDLDLLMNAGLLLNDGSGHFADVTTTHMPPGTSFFYHASADLDGDGDLDLVLGTAGQPTVLVNDGTGVFTVRAGALPTIARYDRVLLGDLDADGDIDLVLTAATGQPMQTFVNNGAGVFQALVTALPPPLSPSQATALVDLDGDHFADLITIDDQPTGPVLQVHHSVFGALFQARPPIPTGALPATVQGVLGDPAFADLDRDGDLDIVLGGTSIFLLDRNLDYQPLQRSAVPLLPATSSISAGDLDGDGALDLVIGEQIVRGDGDGSFGAAQALPVADILSKALFDADGDGDLDIAYGTAQGAGVLRNQAGTFTPMASFPVGLVTAPVLAADFDGDGRDDLLASGQILPNLGASFGVGPVLPTSFYSFALAVDLDRDGRIDLLLDNGNVLRNLGGFNFQNVATMPTVGYRAIVAADFDGDGFVDIATSSITSGLGGRIPFVQVWLQQNFAFTAGAFVALREETQSLAVGDFDLDGDIDILATDLLRNDGAGNLTATPFAGYGYYCVADIDGDGDLDVASNWGNSTTVHLDRHRQIRSPRMPRLGAPYSIEVTSKPGYGAPTLVQVALAAARIAPQQLGSLGTLHIDPATAFYSPIGTTGTDGVCTFALRIPVDPALAGLDVYWQGIVAETGGARLTGFVHDRVLR